MSNPNILLTRIDNRLVHGQVGVTWTTSLGANLLIVVDDDVAKSQIQQKLMAVTAQSTGTQIRFFSVQHTIDIINKAAPSQKIFIVCKTPHVVRQLVENGIQLNDVNIGNMHFSEGKHPLSKKVYVDDADIEDLRALKNAGVNVFIQDVPGDLKTSFE